MSLTTPKAPVRPGPPEIVVGLVIMAIAVYRIPPLLAPHAAALGPVHDLILLALPAVAALSGFVTAARARVRSWSAVGLRRAPAGALLAGLGLGVALGGVTALVDRLLGVETPAAPTLLSLLLVGVVTPVAHELLFRGVIASALLSHGAAVGVLGSTVVFTLVYGGAAYLAGVPVVAVAVSAAVVGLVTAELLRRTGSVWPGAVAHVIAVLPVLALA